MIRYTALDAYMQAASANCCDERNCIKCLALHWNTSNNTNNNNIIWLIDDATTR